MCGRLSINATGEQLAKHYKKTFSSEFKGKRFNVGPAQSIPVVTAEGIQMMRFGLLPFWAKSSNQMLINAKAETILEKTTFKGLVKSHRCLVPATGFFEWDKVGDKKVPYHFKLKSRKLFSFAGLYTSRKDPDGHESFSFTIITTEPNKLVGKIHDRMPVILDEDEESSWLNETVSPEDAVLLLNTYPEADMTMDEVDPAVNNTRNDYGDLIKPINSR